MNSELAAMAKTYIGMLQAALSARAKASPTQQQSYEPLVEAMTHLVQCLRKPETTQNELTLAVYLASSVWTEWHDEHTDFWQKLLVEYVYEWDNNDPLVILSEARLTKGKSLEHKANLTVFSTDPF